MKATGCVQTAPHRTHACAHVSRCVSQFIQCTCLGSRCLSNSLCVSPKSSHPRTMSLLGVPEFSAFPLVLTPSTTLLTGIRPNPCATALWGGPSGRLADPTPNTGYEPKFCIDVSSEHTPINLPSRKSSNNLENDATVAASEDFGLPRHSGASRSRHSVASTVPTLLKLGSGHSWRTTILLQAHSPAPGNWQRTTKL